MTSCFSKTRPPHPKDGPWAWLVLFYSSICAVSFAGIIYGYGVILPVLMVVFDQNREKTGIYRITFFEFVNFQIHCYIMLNSYSSIAALVGSLMLGSAFFLCIISTKLCEKYGCRIVIIVGLTTSTTGLIISSFSNSLYPLYFTYSILIGFGASCTLSSNVIMVRKYFKKSYSLAMGIRLAGAGMGMLTFGPFVRYLIDSYGWRNTFRIFAGILAFLISFSFIFDPNVEACEEITTRTEEIDENFVEKKSMKPRKIVLGFLDLSVWTFPEFTISVVGIFIGSWGHLTPLIHMVSVIDYETESH